MKRLTYILILLVFTIHTSANTWTTHFAYNSVDKIATGGGQVYGVSTGALFAIDAQSEKIRTYSHQDGMHGTKVACITWLESVQSLMIVYADGKIDLLSNGQFHYIPDLYNKDVTFSKRCHSLTVTDSLVYMAMDYGVQTFHIRKREFIDTYFIGPEAEVAPVYSIALTDEAIYAAGDTILYGASLTDNIVDYSYWSHIPLPANGKIQGIVQSGDELYLLQGNTCYRRRRNTWQAIDNQSYNVLNVIDGQIVPSAYPTVSNNGLWMAAGAQGVIRQMETGEKITYHLDGPLTNTPYRLSYQYGQLYMVTGGRWAAQYQNPGMIMCYDGSKWNNITQQDIIREVGGPCLDIMNIAVDPDNPAHFFATSYGTGMYEFLNGKCIKRWDATNSILGSAVEERPETYTRLDGAIYDAQGNLWVMNTGNILYNIAVFSADGKQIGLNFNEPDGSRYFVETGGQILFDNHNPNHVWALIPRGKNGNAGLALIDTKGTLAYVKDDRSLLRTNWTDQQGNNITRNAIYAMRQDAEGNIWLATNDGVMIIPSDNDYFTADNCRVVHMNSEEGSEHFEEEINDIAFDHLGRAWIATTSTGVYVLESDASTIAAHYAMDNSALPANGILSLAYDYTHRRMYIGSSLGLVSYTDPTSTLNDGANTFNEPIDLGSMMQWTSHFAYTDIEELQLSPSYVYALSEGALCAINRDDESMSYYSKLNGLNGSSIHSIAYDSHTQTLLINYDDGMIDLMDANEVIRPVADLYLKQLSTSKQVQNIAFRDGKAYMAMSFGIVVMNIRKQEISDTYYIGAKGSEVSVNALAIIGDSIFAATDSRLYRANMHDNLVDYALWKSEHIPNPITDMVTYNGKLYMLMDSTVYADGTRITAATDKFVALYSSRNSLLARTNDNRIFDLSGATAIERLALAAYQPHYALKDGDSYWLGTNDGIVHLAADLSVQKYQPDGPSSNMPYSLTTSGSQLWAVPGGRWATEYKRQGQVMYFNGTKWDNYTYADICRRLGFNATLIDFCHVAVDPADSRHFYVSSFGTGLIEFRTDGTAKRHSEDNSPIRAAATGTNSYRYCRVDALTYDPDGNLWLTNTGELATNIHVIAPDQQWHSFDLYHSGQRIILNTVSKFLIDNRNSNYKWIASARDAAGLVLLYDNGTPYTGYDDQAIMRSTFVDQDKKSITIDRLNTIAQDYNGDLWLGTGEGILIIDAATNLFTSNSCRRLKISRHDGTNLADYLLGTEQINSIVFAGGNRIWIGTEVSGAYLVHMVTKEGIYEPEILAHFTTLNSPMPSDCVLSIAIDERGEVYIGTAKGLVSYRGDATEPEKTFADAYVYPNPVRPNYEGVITISGLMDNTTVYIADAAGNVVCRTHSNGGTAVWDGKTQSGKKAHSGVYTIYCNTADGQKATTLKVLIMH